MQPNMASSPCFGPRRPCKHLQQRASSGVMAGSVLRTGRRSMCTANSNGGWQLVCSRGTRAHSPCAAAPQDVSAIMPTSSTPGADGSVSPMQQQPAAQSSGSQQPVAMPPASSSRNSSSDNAASPRSSSSSSSSGSAASPTSSSSSSGSGSAVQQTAPQSTAQRRSPLIAAAAAAGLAALGAGTYQLLSAQPQLPPVEGVLGMVAALVFGGVPGCLLVTKALMGDKFHAELHRGRLYLCIGVPSRGPALQPGVVAVRPTGDVRGNGAYATGVIPVGTHIADYSGDLLDRPAFYQRYPDGYGDYAMAVDDEWVIDAASRVADTSSFHPVHMNHSAGRANVARYYARASRRVAFFATRDIQPGEELLYDYGRDYWRGREHLELP